MRQALDPSHPPWNAAQIEEAIHQTAYYQNTSDTTRQWDILVATDPASAAQRSRDMQQHVSDLAQALGINLSWAIDDNASGYRLTGQALRGNWTDQQIRQNLLTLYSTSGQTGGTGDIAGSTANVKALASQYGLPMSDQTAQQWGIGMLEGVVSQDALKAYMVEQAKSLYPGLSSALDSGVTVAQYADPYKQIAVQELGINPSDFNLSDTKWSDSLNQVDPKTGDRTAMTLAQWQTQLRSDPQYGYNNTHQAEDAAAQFINQLGSRMGVV
jgi:hypothetical protein